MTGTTGRRVRLEDVAAEVGLSSASVSLVLRGVAGPSAATRERVLAAAERLGYRPDRAASLLAARRSRLIGVLLDVTSTFHAELVADLHDTVEQYGYELVLSTITRRRTEQRAIETLLDSRCEALVLLGPESSTARLEALDRQIPVVAVSRQLRPGSSGRAGVDVVRVADEDGVGLAVDHLVGLGHRHIAYLDGGPGRIAGDRRRGYQRSMRRAGLAERVIPGGNNEAGGMRAGRALLDGLAMGDGQPRLGGLVVGDGQVPLGGLARVDGRARVGDQVLAGDQVPTGGSAQNDETGRAAMNRPGVLPSAIVAFNDRSAVGLLDVFARAGVDVPGQVSVVGYDDDALSRLAHVSLTTVGQDTDKLSEHTVAAVVERLDGGRTEHREVVLPPYLAVRATTAPPRAR